MSTTPALARRGLRLEWALGLAAAAAAVALMCWVGRGMWFRLDVFDFLVGREAGSLESWLRPHAGHLQWVAVGMHRLLYGLFHLDFWPWYYLPAIVGYAGLALLLWRVLLRRGADRGVAWVAYLTVLFLGVSAFLSSIAVGGLIVLALLLVVAHRLDGDAAPSLLAKVLVSAALLVMVTSSSLGVAGTGACLLAATLTVALTVALAATLAAAITTARPAAAASFPTTRDAVLVAAGGATGLAGLLLSPDMRAVPQQGLDPRDIRWGLDRRSLAAPRLGALRSSDAFRLGTLLYPVVTSFAAPAAAICVSAIDAMKNPTATAAGAAAMNARRRRAYGADAPTRMSVVPSPTRSPWNRENTMRPTM